MQIVATFAKRGADEREVTRTMIFRVEVKSFTTHLHHAVAMACAHCERGERVVRIAEGGYQ